MTSSPTVTQLAGHTATQNPINSAMGEHIMSYPEDDYGTDMEAIETQRMDADLEMAQMTRHANYLAKLRKQGICTHSSSVMYRDPPFYPTQVGLRPGQSRCTEGTGGCTFVANSDAEWYAAQDAL